MKKALLVTAVVVGIGFIGFQAANARMGGGGMMGGGPNCGNCPQGQGTATQLTEAEQKALEKFHADTKELRKQIVVKHAELQALQNQTNPDAKKIATLTGELYDLKTTLTDKAKAAGITTGAGCPNGGPGMMGGGMMHGRGKMHGNGMMQKVNGGPHMMGNR